MKNKKAKDQPCRLGTVGGQAVMEGVMMRSKTLTAIAVRRPGDKKIVAKTSTNKSVKDKLKFLKFPLIRGVVNFVETLIMSTKIMTSAVDMLGLEESEGEPSRFEKWLDKHLGEKLMPVVTGIGMVLGLVLALALFVYLPMTAVILIQKIADLGAYKNVVEGMIKLLIFIAYLWLVSFIPDIKRVFQYHGAEHKSIFCYESGTELTVDNVKKQSRYHPRCGTSFMFLMVILSVAVAFLLPDSLWENWLLRLALKLFVVTPLVVAVGYEVIMYAGKHSNPVIRAISAPGLWVQRITTKEPDESMMEVAIASLKLALPEEFPGFSVPDPDEAAAPDEQINQEDNNKEEVPADETV